MNPFQIWLRHSYSASYAGTPRLWEKHIDKILRRIDFTPTTHEPCVYSGIIEGERVLLCCLVGTNLRDICGKYDWLKTGPARDDITPLPTSKTFTDAFRTAEGDRFKYRNWRIDLCYGYLPSRHIFPCLIGALSTMTIFFDGRPHTQPLEAAGFVDSAGSFVPKHAAL
eukprot:scaffold6767_cov108-Skeletonema_marinoi.AAC.5